MCVENLFKRWAKHYSKPNTEELSYIKRQFSLSGYSGSLVKQTFRKTPTGITLKIPSLWQAIPYIASTSGAVARLLKSYGVAHRPAEILHWWHSIAKFIRVSSVRSSTEPSARTVPVITLLCVCTLLLFIKRACHVHAIIVRVGLTFIITSTSSLLFLS